LFAASELQIQDIDIGRCASLGPGNDWRPSSLPSSNWERARFHCDLFFVGVVPWDTIAEPDQRQMPEFQIKTWC